MKSKILLACFLLFSLCGVTLTEDVAGPYLLKSIWLEKFARFVTWSEGSDIKDKSKPFIIGIIGKHPFGQILNNIYKQNKIKDKKVEIKYISDVDKIPDCHLLYISASCKSYLADVLAVTKDKPVLTVGDTEGFAEKGVLINMYIDENKIRIQISAAIIRHRSLQIDPLLLEIAAVVKKKSK